MLLFAATPGAHAALAQFPFTIVNADTVETNPAGTHIIARGNVVLEYRGYRVTADVLEADLDERVAIFRGRVTINTGTRTVQGNYLRLDLRSRVFELEGARVQIPPEELQMGAVEPVYAMGALIRGEPERLTVERGGVTTCNLEPPHYLFDAKRITIIPGRRLEARKVSFYALGHKIITLPGLSIPLRTIDQQSSRLVPVVGQSVDEGYYLKTAYFYVLGALLGNLRLDLMSKKGIGIGFDQPYTLQHMNGTAHVYQLRDRAHQRQDFNARANHNQQFGEFNVQFNGDYRMNSLDYVASNSSSVLTDLTVNRRGANGVATDFGINRSGSSFSGTTTGTWTGRLHHTQTLLGLLRSNFSFDMSQPFGLTSASSGRLNSHMDMARETRPGQHFGMQLVVDRIDTLGGSANTFFGTQRLPELNLTTESSRFVPKGFLATSLPISAELQVGNLKELGFTSASSSSAAISRIRSHLRLSGSPQILVKPRHQRSPLPPGGPQGATTATAPGAKPTAPAGATPAGPAAPGTTPPATTPATPGAPATEGVTPPATTPATPGAPPVGGATPPAEATTLPGPTEEGITPPPTAATPAMPGLAQQSRWNISLPFEFHQMVYKSDEAQWVASANPSITYNLGPASQIVLTDSVLRQNGFTPFQSDFFPQYHNATFGLTIGSRLRGGYSGAYPGYGTSAYGSVGPVGGYGGYPGSPGDYGRLDPAGAGRAYLSLRTGYDFENDISQDLIIDTRYQPNAHHQLSVSTGYDWSGKQNFGGRSRLRDITINLRTDYGLPFQLSAGALWDTTKNRLGSIRTSVDTRLTPLWHLQAIYGRFSTGGFSQQYMLTRDLHCWEASVTYVQEPARMNSGTTLWLVIKAFPFNQQFGIGQSGGYLTSDLGQIY